MYHCMTSSARIMSQNTLFLFFAGEYVVDCTTLYVSYGQEEDCAALSCSLSSFTTVSQCFYISHLFRNPLRLSSFLSLLFVVES